MNPNLISSSYIQPFNKTFQLSKPANYFTKIISLHYINSLLHISKLLTEHRTQKKIQLEDINLATQLLQDPIHKAEYNINKKILNAQSGGSKKITIRKNKQKKEIVQKVIIVEKNKFYQKTKQQLEKKIKHPYEPYKKVFTQFKKDTNISISTDAKNKISQLSNELINQLLTLSHQKSQLIPNNQTIRKNDILYTLLEL